MENRLIHLTAQRLAARLNYYVGMEGLELQKLVLGMEMVVINVSKLVVLYLLSAILGILLQTVVLHGAYMLIKRYSFGLHALNSTVCTLVTCILFGFVPWLLQGMSIDNMAVVAIFMPVIVCLYLYAPADTKARPLIGVKTRAQLKKRAVGAAIVLMVTALLIPSQEVKFLLCLGAIYQCTFILPITYKLLKRSEKNYEIYENA